MPIRSSPPVPQLNGTVKRRPCITPPCFSLCGGWSGGENVGLHAQRAMSAQSARAARARITRELLARATPGLKSARIVAHALRGVVSVERTALRRSQLTPAEVNGRGMHVGRHHLRRGGP